jgi:hypothetical protein
VLPRFEIVEQAEDAVDVGVLVVEAIEGAGEPHRVARVVALVELLAGPAKDDTAASNARRNNLMRVLASALAA